MAGIGKRNHGPSAAALTAPEGSRHRAVAPRAGHGPRVLFACALLILVVVPAGVLARPGPSTGCGYVLTVTALPGSGAAPLLVRFNATVSTGTATYTSWSFGDGSVWNGTGPGSGSPFHRYPLPGHYNVTATAAQGGCLETRSLTVLVVPGPIVITLEPRPTSGSVPLTVAFNATVAGGTGTYVTAHWAFGDGGVGSGLDVAYTYLRAGRFTAILNITDAAGSSGTATSLVIASSAPTAAYLPVLPGTTAAAVGVAALAAVAVALLVYREFRRPGPMGEVAEEMPVRAERAPDDRVAAVPPTPSFQTPRTPGPVFPRAPTGPSPGIPSPPPGSVPPTAVVAERRRLTERVILHLGQQGRLGPEEVAPLGMTQAGMTERLQVGQGTLTNVLRRLDAAGALNSTVRHVVGRPRRLRVYTLSARGEILYRELRGRRPP